MDLQVAVVRAAAKAVMAEQKVKLNYMVGTLIEVPRGALTADLAFPIHPFEDFKRAADFDFRSAHMGSTDWSPWQ